MAHCYCAEESVPVKRMIAIYLSPIYLSTLFTLASNPDQVLLMSFRPSVRSLNLANLAYGQSRSGYCQLH
jgi:hypothetical protein